MISHPVVCLSVCLQLQYRLSTDVIPIAYDLTLRPDLEADSFEGNVKIKLKLGKNIRQFALHKGTDMTITKAEVLGATANENLNLVRIRPRILW